MANVPIKDVNVGIAGKHIRSFSTHHSIGLQNNENEPIEINSNHVKRLEERSKMAVIPTNHKIIHSMHQKFTIDGARNMLSNDSHQETEQDTPDSPKEMDLDLLIKIRTELKSILEDLSK